MPPPDRSTAAGSSVDLIECRPGAGLRVADTGLSVGGFAIAELLQEDGEPASISLDSFDALICFEPRPWFEAFVDLALGDLASTDTATWQVESDPSLELERIHVELRHGDVFALRLGKFRAPVGRWNLVRAEPFVWTTSDPLLTERAFDESVTGAMATGTAFTRAGVLQYALYGQATDPIDPGRDPADPLPADRTIGARLELSAELLLASGGLDERDLWGGYLQADYRLVDRRTALAPSGLSSSVSLIF